MLGSAIRETLYVSPPRASVLFQVAGEESDDAAEPDESLAFEDALTKR
jgi:hypothetical protein